MKKIFFLLFVVALLILSACKPDVSDVNVLAKCLTEKGVKMYGAEWCGHCQNQKKMFGEAFQFVNYIDCDKNVQACDEAAVRGYPTWLINGQKYEGEQTLEELASAAGCN